MGSTVVGFSVSRMGERGILDAMLSNAVSTTLPGEESSSGPVFDRLKQLVHDRLGQHQSGQGQNPRLVRPVYPDRSQQRPAPVHPVRQEYRVKEKKDESVPMQVDSEKTPAKVVQVEDGKGKAQDAQKGPVIMEKPVNVS